MREWVQMLQGEKKYCILTVSTLSSETRKSELSYKLHLSFRG